MKKEELLKSVMAVLKSHKIKNEDLEKELALLIGPKTRVYINEFPDKLDAKNNIAEIYCIRIGEYLPVEEFSKSSKTKNGYSKESKIGIKIWNIYNKEIQILKQNIVDIMSEVLEGTKTIEEAKQSKLDLETKISEIEEKRKNPYGLELFNQYK